MPHSACASLGVHEHPVPSVEDEGGMIRMCDPALGEDVRVADHLPAKSGAGERPPAARRSSPG